MLTGNVAEVVKMTGNATEVVALLPVRPEVDQKCEINQRFTGSGQILTGNIAEMVKNDCKCYGGGREFTKNVEEVIDS